ncbi:PREDICTED: AAA-ATPase At3g50940-like [Ipomoea nil]|uniref:AAA-ATPase At3g50940-like n=1 Tax=Ipomoea nil TaxID=35883 RepID=UPI000900F2FE|nr:PREDICTED: AAA-ATPase At3g50940-like [Ipomoea nil]
MFSLADMPSTASVLSAYTAFTALAVLMRTVVNELQAMANQLVPGRIRDKVLSKLGGLFYCNFTSQVSLVIDEYNNGITHNEIFEASEVYLGTKLSPSADRLKISKAPEEKALSFIITKGEKIIDTFEGMEFIWELKVSESRKPGGYNDYDQGYSPSETMEHRSFELSFNKKFREMVFKSYIPFVLERSKAIKEEKKTIKLHSLGNWHASVNLEHPSTFETLAMDGELKKEVIADLERFVRRKDYYRRVGKAWKRGYLLYGPPGTGKSSLIAAMANYLKFDIYDLDLASLHSNLELHRLLATTKNRSILVIEDIDCSIELQNRNLEQYSHNQGDQSQLTLSGLLNFIDGLWSCCGDERIIVFTTNYKDRLDPALLRPGRMDMHIHMSYCTPTGFRVLASNYHGLKDHCSFIQIDKLLEEVEVTPAEIAEELMKSEEADVALEGLIKFMQKKKKTAEGDDEVKVGRGTGICSEEIKAVVKKTVVKNKSKKRRNMVKKTGCGYVASSTMVNQGLVTRRTGLAGLWCNETMCME